MKTFDAIVLGAGAMGSATAYHLAKARQRVLLLEQFEIDHQKGSSYGHSRIIRYAYDHPAYIDLARAAYPAWFDLQEESGETLYTKTGGLDFGSAEAPMLRDTFTALQATQIPYEDLSPDDARQRFPQFHFEDDMKLLYQPDSGILAASKCVRVHIRLAEKFGAILKDNTHVSQITVNGSTVDVQTANEIYSTGKLIITAGSWTKPLLAMLDLDLPLLPLRTQVAYFQPDIPTDYEPGNFPVFIAHLSQNYSLGIPYGLPSYDNSGLKLGFHGGSTVNHPAEINYTPDDKFIEDIQLFKRRYLPQANGSLATARVCLYTMTPDEHFIIDKHPEYENIVFGAGFSGHGFKFSDLFGKILTDLALKGETEHDIDLFSASRFMIV